MDTDRRMSGGDMMVIVDATAIWPTSSSSLSGEMSQALQMAQHVIAQSRRLQHELRTALDEAERADEQHTGISSGE